MPLALLFHSPPLRLCFHIFHQKSFFWKVFSSEITPIVSNFPFSSMNLLNSHSLLTPLQPTSISSSSSSPPKLSFSPLTFISKTPKAFHLQNAFSQTTTISFSPLCSTSKREFRKKPRVSDSEALIWNGEGDGTDGSMEFEDIATDGVVYKKTLRLVECSMFAAVTGLAYFLSNSLAIEEAARYFSKSLVVTNHEQWIIYDSKEVNQSLILSHLHLQTPKAFHFQNAFSPSTTISFAPLCSPSKREFRNPRVLDREALIWSGDGDDITDGSMEFEDIATDGVVYKKTLRLVECSMFAAVTGLAYFLSNSLAIENYFGCFFSLPIVISSLRWDLAAGRKTMVATSMLLLTLSGPVKAATYLLMHGLVGLAMGSLWRLGANWGLSIAACTLVRAVGLMGYVLISSFLIRENILALITANLHASLSYVLTAIGVNTIPSMTLIYSIFGMVLLLNCVFFVSLLHILYAVFLARLGMKASLTLPRWLEKAI